jgi:hypothetical protein
MAELVHAVLILCHFHALCGFIYGTGIQPDIDLQSDAPAAPEPERSSQEVRYPSPFPPLFRGCPHSFAVPSPTFVVFPCSLLGTVMIRQARVSHPSAAVSFAALVARYFGLHAAALACPDGVAVAEAGPAALSGSGPLKTIGRRHSLPHPRSLQWPILS